MLNRSIIFLLLLKKILLTLNFWTVQKQYSRIYTSWHISTVIMLCSNITQWFIHNRCLFIEFILQLPPKPTSQTSWDIQWCRPTCLLFCTFDNVDETSAPQLLRYETRPWHNMSWMVLKGLITVCGFLLARKPCMRERRPWDAPVSCFCIHNMVWTTWVLLPVGGEVESICVSVCMCIYCIHICFEMDSKG